MQIFASKRRVKAAVIRDIVDPHKGQVVVGSIVGRMVLQFADDPDVTVEAEWFALNHPHIGDVYFTEGSTANSATQEAFAASYTPVGRKKDDAAS